jgi:MinD-like ATPase involved in chromosome partitioning or flagellar assembly
MNKIISIHSFRGGTGKSNITGNLSYALAARGKKVCVIDTDVQSPGIHVPLQLLNYKGPTLNDFLFNNMDINKIAIDISSKLNLPENSLHFIPCSINTRAITKILKDGYDVSALADAFAKIQKHLKLDYLLIDTHPGLNEETLLSIAMSDVLYVVMRPDEQDFQGTSVTIDIAHKLNVKKISIIANMVAPSFNKKQVRDEVIKAFNCSVAEILPHTYKLTELASNGLLCARFPNEEWSLKINNIANSLIAAI